MDPKSLVAGVLALAVVSCGGDGPARVSGDEPETAVDGLLPGPASEPGTAALTSEAARFGQRIPTACISTAEAAQLTGASSAEAGRARSCRVGTTG